MAGAPLPNDDLAELAALLGIDNVRLLVRTFLREYPDLIGQLREGDRRTRHRIAHSLKSNARVIGARALSAHMAAVEEQLADDTRPDLEPDDLATIIAEFETVAK